MRSDVNLVLNRFKEYLRKDYLNSGDKCTEKMKSIKEKVEEMLKEARVLAVKTLR